MKKIKEIFVVILILLIIGTTSSFATTGKSTANGIRIRKEPSTNGEVLTHVNNGDSMEVIEKDGEWYKIKFQEFEGYIHSDYIKIDGEVTEVKPTVPEEKPSETPEEEPVKPEDPKPEEKPEAVYPINATTISSIKVYIIPSVTASVISNVAEGQTVTVKNRLNKWSYISYEGGLGWTRNYLLEDSISAEKPEGNNAVETPTVETPTVEKPSAITKGYINVTEAIMREGPSTSANIIVGISLNTEVKIIAEEGEWYKIEYNGKTGYTVKRLISDKQVSTNRSLVEPRQNENGIENQTGYVNVSVANVRAGASTNTQVITTLKLKAEVNIIGEEADFYKIEIKNGVGYMAKSLVSDSLEKISTPVAGQSVSVSARIDAAQSRRCGRICKTVFRI